MCAPVEHARLWLPGVAATLLLLPASTASAATPLRWMQPVGSAVVDEFRIYVGPIPDGGDLVYAGLPAPDASGVYAADVEIDEIEAGIPVYVWLTAANETGESPPSNAEFYPLDCEPLLDPDCDGVPSDGSPGDLPCATGETLDCDDNCPYAANPSQDDTAGIGAGSFPDGVGDACQCGDVNGDGQVSSVDASITMAALMVPPRATLTRPDLCDVGGSRDCGTVDAAITFRALMLPPLAAIQQQCEAAAPPAAAAPSLDEPEPTIPIQTLRVQDTSRSREPSRSGR